MTSVWPWWCAFAGRLRVLRWLPLPLILTALGHLYMVRLRGSDVGVSGKAVVDASLDHLAATHPLALHTLTTTYLRPPSTLPYNLSTDPTYLASTKLGSWNFINHYITRLFDGERGGFFVEAGALDGQQLSNTLWLEQELGWTGLLIEPNPYSYQHLRHKHRKAWTANSCISSDNFTKKSILVDLSMRVGYDNPKWFVKGTSYELGMKLGNDFSDFLNIADKTYHMTHCFPLHSYLLALNVTTVDLLSLDTQGSEIDIVKSIPWEDVTIRVLVVEIADEKNFQSDFVEYLRVKGYVLVGNSVDYIFVKTNDSAFTRLTSHNDWYLKVLDMKNGNVVYTKMFAKLDNEGSNDNS